MKFYICKTCGNIITKVQASAVPVMCCGKPMEELVAGSVEAAQEKHIPVYSLDNTKLYVTVGEIEHPMTPEHYIPWVALETSHGAQVRWLQPTDAPSVSFLLAEGEEAKVVYAYCNLHGLWQKEL